MSLNQTPSGERVHIGFFGRRNAGKSSLMNAVAGQAVAVVSRVKGTTTDPVRKAMELLPVGPVLLIDTPGFDDEGELGSLRVRKARQVLDQTDVAVLVVDATQGTAETDLALIRLFKEKGARYVVARNKCDLLECPLPELAGAAQADASHSSEASRADAPPPVNPRGGASSAEGSQTGCLPSGDVLARALAEPPQTEGLPQRAPHAGAIAGAAHGATSGEAQGGTNLAANGPASEAAQGPVAHGPAGAATQGPARPATHGAATRVPAGSASGGEICVSAATGMNIGALKERIAALAVADEPRLRIVGDLISPSDFVVLVTPIDKAAPKGRLILPQQQVIRDVLEADAVAVVVKEFELRDALGRLAQPPAMVITDSQVFAKAAADTPPSVPLTSFSILMARYKGLLDAAVDGAKALDALEDGDRVLICEGCTHHRQCDDIGTVKLPRWIRQYTGKAPEFAFASGTEFPDDISPYRLVVHCGGCMLNAREVRRRRSIAEEQGAPITNYGVLIAYMQGILERCLSVFPHLLEDFRQE